MDMTLSKRGDYVVRSALCLARAYESGDYRKIREVVAEMDVPQTFASQILADLVRAGIADSKAGKAGGYRLARDPMDVSLLQIVEAGEGPLRSERCALGEGPCRWEKVCPLHETWSEATASLRRTLSETSLADIVKRDEDLERPDHAVPLDSHRHGSLTLELVDWVQIELPTAVVCQRLQRNESWIAKAVKAGYGDAEGLRCTIDQGGTAWSIAGSPVVVLGKGGTNTERERQLIWEAGGRQGTSSRFEGSLILREIDDERTELRLAGKFRPPLLPASTDRALTERLSRATLRTTLREIAKVLENRTERSA